MTSDVIEKMRDRKKMNEEEIVCACIKTLTHLLNFLKSGILILIVT
jgi:hypothetical protein